MIDPTSVTKPMMCTISTAGYSHSVVAHRHRQRQALDRRQRRTGIGHRNSTVLLPTMMRSARISSGLLRFG